VLAKNPSSRPQTMAAISEAFDQILSTLSGAGARARTATPPAPAPPVPEDPASLTDAEPIRPPTLDDTVRTPAALPPSEALATTQFPVSSAGRPEAQPVPTSEIAGAAEPSLVPRLRTRLFPFLLAGLIIAGAGITATVVVLSAGGGSAPERPSSGGEGVLEAPAPAPVKGAAGELEARCQGYETARQWAELERCADELRPLDAERAAGLKLRAQQGIQSAFRAAAVEAALRDGNLKRAKAELEYIRPDSAEHADITRRYVLAEDQAIGELAAELARVKDATCKKYNALLEKERTLKPARVTEEAARRTTCSPPPAKCNADALAQQGRVQMAAGQLEEALASYEAAYTCQPVPTRALRPLTIACTSRNLAKARSYWKQLTPMMRNQTLGTCVKNGISAAALNAP